MCATDSADEDAPEHVPPCLPREIRELLRPELPLVPVAPPVSSTASPVKSRKRRTYCATQKTTPRGNTFSSDTATNHGDDSRGMQYMESPADTRVLGAARTEMDLAYDCSRKRMVWPRSPEAKKDSVSPFATKRQKHTRQPHVRTLDDQMTSVAPTVKARPRTLSRSVAEAPVVQGVAVSSRADRSSSTKKTNFRSWNYFTKKVPFDRFPLLSTLCESDSSKAEDEAPGSNHFLPLRAFNDEQAYESFNTRKEKMEQLLKAMHGKTNTNTQESLLLTSLCGMEGSDVMQLEKMIPILFWVGHAERYQAALKLLTSAFKNAKTVCLEDVILLIKPGDSNDKITQLEFGSSLENMAKQNGERVVEFSQRKVRSWFKMLHPVKGHVSVNAVCDQFWFSKSQEFFHTTDRSRKKIIRSIQQLCHVKMVRHPLQGSTRSLEPVGLCLSVTDFDRLLSRCILAHALDKVRTLVGSYSELRVDLKCAAIQREVIVSLLINNQFWGEKEAESVMASLLRVHGDVTTGDRVCFQKAKAQGMRIIYEDIEKTADAEES